MYTAICVGKSPRGNANTHHIANWHRVYPGIGTVVPPYVNSTILQFVCPRIGRRGGCWLLRVWYYHCVSFDRQGLPSRCADIIYWWRREVDQTILNIRIYATISKALTKGFFGPADISTTICKDTIMNIMLHIVYIQMLATFYCDRLSDACELLYPVFRCQTVFCSCRTAKTSPYKISSTLGWTCWRILERGWWTKKKTAWHFVRNIQIDKTEMEYLIIYLCKHALLTVFHCRLRNISY